MAMSPAASRRQDGGHNQTSSAALQEIAQKAEQRCGLTDPSFWRAYPDIEAMALETNKTAIVRILTNFAAAHRKHAYLFQRLKGTIMKNLRVYDAPELAAICHAFVVLGFLRDDIVTAMTPRVVATIHLCTVTDLARLLDAYASLRCNCPEAIRVITAETVKKLDEFSVSDLMTHASSFARLNSHNHRLFSLIATRMLHLDAQCSKYEELDLEKQTASSAAEAVHCSTCGFPVRGPAVSVFGRSPPTTMGEQHLARCDSRSNIQTRAPSAPNGQDGCGPEIGSVSCEAVCLCSCEEPVIKAPALPYVNDDRPVFTARDLTLAAYSFAKLGFHFPSIFELVSRRSRAVIRDLTAHQLQMVAVAYQRAGIRDLALFAQLSEQAQRRIAQFNAESVALLLRSFALFDICDEALLTRVVAQLPRLILTFRPLDVATTLNSFARLNVASRALMAVVMPQVFNQYPKFTPADLQGILHAVARMGTPDYTFLRRFCDRVDLSRLSPGQLTLVVADLPRLGYRSMDLLHKARNEIHTRLNQFSPAMIAQLLAAILFLGLHVEPDWVNFARLLAMALRDTSFNGDKKAAMPSVSAATQLCLAAVSVDSSSWLNASTESAKFGNNPRGAPIGLLPVSASELFYHILSSFDAETLGEVAVTLNLVRTALAATNAARGLDQGLSSLSNHRTAAASLYGEPVAAGLERDAERGLVDVAATLKGVGGLSGVEFVPDPLSMVHTKEFMRTSAESTEVGTMKAAAGPKPQFDPPTSRRSPLEFTPHLENSPNRNIHKLTSKPSDDGSTAKSTAVPSAGSGTSPSSSVSCNGPLRVDFCLCNASLHESNFDARSSTSGPQIACRALDTRVFRMLPYHSFLALPLLAAAQLRRWWLSLGSYDDSSDQADVSRHPLLREGEREWPKRLARLNDYPSEINLRSTGSDPDVESFENRLHPHFHLLGEEHLHKPWHRGDTDRAFGQCMSKHLRALGEIDRICSSSEGDSESESLSFRQGLLRSISDVCLRRLHKRAYVGEDEVSLVDSEEEENQKAVVPKPQLPKNCCNHEDSHSGYMEGLACRNAPAAELKCAKPSDFLNSISPTAAADLKRATGPLSTAMGTNGVRCTSAISNMDAALLQAPMSWLGAAAGPPAEHLTWDKLRTTARTCPSNDGAQERLKPVCCAFSAAVTGCIRNDSPPGILDESASLDEIAHRTSDCQSNQWDSNTGHSLKTHDNEEDIRPQCWEPVIFILWGSIHYFWYSEAIADLANQTVLGCAVSQENSAVVLSSPPLDEASLRGTVKGEIVPIASLCKFTMLLTGSKNERERRWGSKLKGNVLNEVCRAVKISELCYNNMTAVARLQISIILRATQTPIQVCLVPSFAWSLLTSSESKLAFLAILISEFCFNDISDIAK